MQLTRRTFLQSTAAALVTGIAWPEPAEAQSRQQPEVQERTFALPGLSPEHDGLRVAQLSDLHCGAATPRERILDAIRLTNALAPDLVVLTGDYVCRSRDDVAVVEGLLGGLVAPTVAVLGNHDHRVDAAGTTRALERHGYAVLRNQSTAVTLRGAPFGVIGIDDLLTGHASPPDALAGAPSGSRIVLAHGPRTADALARYGEPMLCFSGHTHGGQVSLPIFTRLFYAVARERYTRGAYRLGPIQLYVNRGIGNSALRIRLNSAPEVTLATLRTAAG